MTYVTAASQQGQGEGAPPASPPRLFHDPVGGWFQLSPSSSHSSSPRGRTGQRTVLETEQLNLSLSGSPFSMGLAGGLRVMHCAGGVETPTQSEQVWMETSQGSANLRQATSNAGLVPAPTAAHTFAPSSSTILIPPAPQQKDLLQRLREHEHHHRTQAPQQIGAGRGATGGGGGASSQWMTPPPLSAIPVSFPPTHTTGLGHYAPPFSVEGVDRGRSGDLNDSSQNSQTSPASLSHSATNLHVRHLPQWMDDDGLERLFSRFGGVDSATVMRDIHTAKSLGRGFVRFRRHEDAARAKEGMHNYMLDAEEAGCPTGSTSLTCQKLLDRETTCSGEGGASRGQGGGERPVTSGLLSVVPLSVQWANAKHDKLETQREHYRKLFVRNVPASVTREMLRQLFAAYGRVSDISLHDDTPAAAETAPATATGAAATTTPAAGSGARKIAFVSYTTEGCAAEAAKGVHNTKPFAACLDVALMVKLAEDYPVHQGGRLSAGGRTNTPQNTGEAPPAHSSSSSISQTGSFVTASGDGPANCGIPTTGVPPAALFTPLPIPASHTRCASLPDGTSAVPFLASVGSPTQYVATPSTDSHTSFSHTPLVSSPSFVEVAPFSNVYNRMSATPLSAYYTPTGTESVRTQQPTRLGASMLSSSRQMSSTSSLFSVGTPVVPLASPSTPMSSVNLSAVAGDTAAALHSSPGHYYMACNAITASSHGSASSGGGRGSSRERVGGLSSQHAHQMTVALPPHPQGLSASPTSTLTDQGCSHVSPFLSYVGAPPTATTQQNAAAPPPTNPSFMQQLVSFSILPTTDPGQPPPPTGVATTTLSLSNQGEGGGGAAACEEWPSSSNGESSGSSPSCGGGRRFTNNSTLLSTASGGATSSSIVAPFPDDAGATPTGPGAIGSGYFIPVQFPSYHHAQPQQDSVAATAGSGGAGGSSGGPLGSFQAGYFAGAKPRFTAYGASVGAPSSSPVGTHSYMQYHHHSPPRHPSVHHPSITPPTE